MHRNWTNKYVDLALLASEIVEFLKAKDFEIMKGEKQNGYEILAEDSSTFKIDGYIRIIIEGEPENFMVNVERCKEKNHYLPPILTSMLGGGYFYLRRLKSEEVWIKLEKEFWKYIENAVLRLTGSAQL